MARHRGESTHSVDGFTVVVYEVTAPRPTYTALRGLGRSAYRAGLLAHQAPEHAAGALGITLTAAERSTVMAGWACERSESPRHLR